MWVSAEIFAIAAQAACGSPKAIALRSSPPETTSMVKHSFSAGGTSSVAASISCRTGVIPRVPMMRLAVISAPHPVGHVDDVVHGAAGEEVLVPAGEADHLVREHGGADDEVHIALDAQAVDLHAHRGGVGEQPAGQARDLLRGDLAEVRDLVLVVPGMVDDLPAG